jgi:hypothetical protein
MFRGVTVGARFIAPLVFLREKRQKLAIFLMQNLKLILKSACLGVTDFLIFCRMNRSHFAG